MIDEETLRFNLLFGLPIQYDNINIYQPTIKDYCDLPIRTNGYYIYKYLYCIQPEHLDLDEKLIELLKKDNKSLFEILFIHDEMLKIKNELNGQNSLILNLSLSLSFFLKIDVNQIKLDVKNQQLIIENKDNNDTLFILNNDNFEEFSALIRLICSSDMMEVKKKDENIKYPKDPSLRKKMEKILRQNAENEERKRKENMTTIVDVMSRVIAHENTKYDYFSILNLTIWQLFQEYATMYVREDFDFEKRKITSGQFDYSKQKVDLNWGNKLKIKLPDVLKTK